MSDLTLNSASLKHKETDFYQPIWPKEMLNTPERILKEIKKAQKIVCQQEDIIDELKEELKQHLQNGDIEEKYEHDGITASLRERKYWVYSEAVNKLKKQEEINKIATKKVTKYWWIR
jgi:hypothetical protein